MKYIVDLPDAYTSKSALFGDILSIPICLEGGKRYGIPTAIKLEPYTELDEDESYGVSRYKSIGLAFLKWLGSDAGDKLKSADDVYKFLDKNCCNKDSVENEVWELANYMGRMSLTERDLCFGFPLPQEVTMNLSYREAKAKYDAWKKEKEEIRVGDEVKFDIGNNNDMKAIALDQTGLNGEWSVLTENGCVEEYDEEELYKTGKHFNDVEELLKKMREEP